VYSRNFDSEAYEICKTFAPNRGLYPFPWPLHHPPAGTTHAASNTARDAATHVSRDAEINAASDAETNPAGGAASNAAGDTETNPAGDTAAKKLPRCAILHQLLSHAQRVPREFVLEIFAPSPLLDADWGQLQVPVLGADQPLAKAHPFLLRPWERLQSDYKSRSDCLRRKHAKLRQGEGEWHDCDAWDQLNENLRTAHAEDAVVALRRTRSIPRAARKDWLDAVLGSMVPLAIWPRLAHGDAAMDPEASGRLEACLKRLKLGHTPHDRPRCPDLDALARDRWREAHAELHAFTLLVDHPHRRPALPLATAPRSSPSATDASPAASSSSIPSATPSTAPPTLFISPS
jgi:hypothetical protein